MVPTFVRPVMAQVTRKFSRSVVSRRRFSSSGEYSTGEDIITIVGFVSRAVAGVALGWGLGIGTIKYPYLYELEKDQKNLREEKEGKAACKRCGK